MHYELTTVVRRGGGADAVARTLGTALEWPVVIINENCTAVEGQPVRVEAGFASGVVHDVPERVVDEDEAVDFLLNTVGVLRAEDGAGSALMGLDLVQGVDLPRLVVEARQLGGEPLARVADGSDEPVDRVVFLAAEGVLDEAAPGRGTAVAVAGGRDLGQWEPSSKASRTGSTLSLRTRHNRSAPVPEAACHGSKPAMPRSATSQAASSIPASSRSSRWEITCCS
ncbi:hypothetical protein [Streptomyces canus]|uniref:hypothetical protein n=1 Tax=Streptomyces canus TaxID=58343 RepID=UPI0027D7EB4F|nr:hypothetical protein [Streptomyces canus]